MSIDVSEVWRRERLERLFSDHAEAVHAYARRRIDATTAEDTVAEVFAVAWRRLDDVPDHALPWLLAVARRVLANQRRGERRRGALLARLAVEPAPAHESEGEGDRPLRAAMARLGDRDREVLMLAAWEELSSAEIATVLGCSRAAANVRLHRARKRLVTALERERDGSHAVGIGVVS